MRQQIEQIVERARFRSEKDVKRVVARILDAMQVQHFMPPANAYGKTGISDFLSLKNGKAIAIETKYGYNKPTKPQLMFGEKWQRGGGLFVVVNERNIVDQMWTVFLFTEGYILNDTTSREHAY